VRSLCFLESKGAKEMKIRFYYTDEEEDYVEEIRSLANEIMMTEGASETQATLRAVGMVDELLEYAADWDDDVVKKKEGTRK
jgi:hypothetical protein